MRVLIAVYCLLFSSLATADTVLSIRLPSGQLIPHTHEASLGAHGDSVFTRVRQMEQRIASEIRTGLLALPEVASVDFTTVSANDFDAVLTGSSNNVVTLLLEGFDVRARVRARGYPVVCPTARVTVTLNDIAVSGSYHFFSGELSGLSVGYSPPGVSVSCSGLLGWPIIGDLLSLFVSPTSLVRREIERALTDFQGLDNMFHLFGLDQLFDDPAAAAVIAQVEQAAGFDVRGFLGQLVTGLNLRVALQTDRRGPGQHVILISGYHSAPAYSVSSHGSLYSVASRGWLDVFDSSANQFHLYFHGQLVGTFGPGGGMFLAPLHPDSSFDVIAFNTVSGVPSFPHRRRFLPPDCTPQGRCIYSTD